MKAGMRKDLSAERDALPRLRREHPKLAMTILGDALYASVPMVEPPKLTRPFPVSSADFG